MRALSRSSAISSSPWDRSVYWATSSRTIAPSRARTGIPCAWASSRWEAKTLLQTREGISRTSCRYLQAFFRHQSLELDSRSKYPVPWPGALSWLRRGLPRTAPDGGRCLLSSLAWAKALNEHLNVLALLKHPDVAYDISSGNASDMGGNRMQRPEGPHDNRERHRLPDLLSCLFGYADEVIGIFSANFIPML